MSTKRYIKLTAEEDEQLREVEQAAGLRAKVKLRASILRLSNQGWDIKRLVSYTGRSRWSILRDYDRWEEQGVEGLVDGTPPGNPLQVRTGLYLYCGRAGQRAVSSCQRSAGAAGSLGRARTVPALPAALLSTPQPHRGAGGISRGS